MEGGSFPQTLGWKKCFIIWIFRNRGGFFHKKRKMPKKIVENSLKNVEKCGIL